MMYRDIDTITLIRFIAKIAHLRWRIVKKWCKQILLYVI